MQDFFSELQWRGFIHSFTPGVEEHLRKGPVTAYIGFDPTASSLHVGSLLPIMGLMHFQRAGHKPIAIAGGGTGMIGDPSGKVQERKLLSLEDIEANLVGIQSQLAHFLDFKTGRNTAIMVNNADWLTTMSLMEFLRDTGKLFSVNEMLAKDSVRNRIDQEQGMSFTEFSYSLLQAYDYLQLHDRYSCTLQMGGSDQWGNIVAGIDLIRRVRGMEVYGITFPLITTSSGVKFGKTEAGTIWLDPQRTSPYRFYQYWYNTDDRDVIRYLKLFTLLSQDRIAELEGLLKTAPDRREAQASLAEDVTRIVHGETALVQAKKASRIFFGGEVTDVSDTELLDIFSDVPSVELPREHLNGAGGLPIIDLLVIANVVKSKGEARRAIQQGGIYLNNHRVSDEAMRVTSEDTIRGKFVVIRKGARNYFLIKVLG